MPSDQSRNTSKSFRGTRIAKAIADAGVASRRDAEAMILAGRVTLNGEVQRSPAINVTRQDSILVDGKPLPRPDRTRLWLYHKPQGLVTTARDPENRPTVFQAMPKDMPRVISVGRLDINTEGLLLLTNDGGLARALELPSTGWLRRYRVRAFGSIEQKRLDDLAQGITIKGERFGPIDAELERVQGGNTWITLTFAEGKNREVKRVLGALGLKVNRLIRTDYGPFTLGDLERGTAVEVSRADILAATEPLRTGKGPVRLRGGGGKDDDKSKDKDTDKDAKREGWAKPKPKTDVKRGSKRSNPPASGKPPVAKPGRKTNAPAGKPSASDATSRPARPPRDAGKKSFDNKGPGSKGPSGSKPANRPGNKGPGAKGPGAKGFGGKPRGGRGAGRRG
ncbi:pseudouridine synthase [Tepidamorphus sp. 3E244]|uniref:pseudouridine synthase n=1 Tax=Tepidamorphus sp. 3E244 TaxID=3385498 RepID=UPI0038FC802D